MSVNRSPQPYVGQEFYTLPDDEISLVDLWLTLSRYKFVIISAIVSVALLAALYGFARPEKITYSTPVRLGMMADADGQYSLVESPAAVMEKLEKVYIPLAIRKLGLLQGDKPQVEVKVSGSGTKTSDSNDLIMLESTVTDIPEEVVARLHAEVVRQLVADHNRYTKRLETDLAAKQEGLQRSLEEVSSDTYWLSREKDLKMAIAKKEVAVEAANDPDFSQTPLLNLTHDLNKAQAQLAKVKNEGLLLENQLSQLDKQSDLVQADIDSLKGTISEANQHLLKAADEAVDEPRAMTMMMIENALQQNRLRLSTLEQQLYLDIPAQHASLEKNIEANSQAQAVQTESIELMQRQKKQILHDQKTSRQILAAELNSLNVDLERLKQEHDLKIAELKTQLSTVESRQQQIQHTEQLSQVIAESPKQIGLPLLVVAGVMLGGLLGVVAAFFLSFLARVKEVKASPDAMQGVSTSEPAKVLREVGRHDDNPAVMPGVVR